ncbi:MAG: hypothetical protein ACTSQA_03465 [Candidatus Heimdallarchaeaceae archaeon]|jgi:hypothetical protein
MTYSQETVTISNQQFKEYKKGLPKGVSARFDRFSGTIFTTGKKIVYGSTYSTQTYLDFYIVLTDKSCLMRFRTSYNAGGWLFIDKQIFMYGNKNKTQTLFKLPFDGGDRKVKSGGNIEEKSDIVVDETLEEMIDFLKSTEDKIFNIKFEGKSKYATTGGFTKGLKRHASLMMEAFEYSKKYSSNF